MAARNINSVCASDLIYISMPRRDQTYCAERSESTRIREWVQRYVVGTSPGAALQGDSSGVSGQLPSSASGFFLSFLHRRLCPNGQVGYQAPAGRVFCSGAQHPSGRHRQWGRTRSPHAAEQTPVSDSFKIIIQHSTWFNIWPLNGLWTNPDIFFFFFVF